MKEKNLAYLKLLSESYPTIQSAATEIINLKAILNLPKGTEYFLSDIHGEYDAFTHLMNSASGVIKDKINEALPEVSEEEKNLLATIIYYPKEKLDYLQSKGKLNNEFYFKILNYLFLLLNSDKIVPDQTFDISNHLFLHLYHRTFQYQ